MGTKKVVGGVEDLEFGMGTTRQIRKGQEVTITQINGSHIPYSDTQSVNQKIDQVQSEYTAVRTDLDNHKADSNNPHNITPNDIGAALEVHTHTISDVDSLQSELDSKAIAIHTHEIDDVIGLQTELDNKANVGDSFLKSEHVQESTGASDAGKPIILGTTGELHPSITGSGAFPVGSFTPTAGNEYPDNTGIAVGGYWTVIGVDDVNGYTFTGGDLVGETAYNGDALINGELGWAFIQIGFSPSDYYRIDGTVAISAPLAGGGQQLKNIAPGTGNGDAVEYSQIAGLATDYIRHDGTIAMTAPLDIGTHRIVNLDDGVNDNDGVNMLQLNTHITDTANPHAVTATQVGADPAGSADTVQANLDTHTADTANPHAVTAAQVGADPVGSADAVQVNLDTHTSNTANPHGVTVGQIGAEPSLPIGTIVMYNGLFIDIPANWALCDGTNGTPDLTDRFIMGTAIEGDIGVTGGSNDAVVVSHTHTANHNHTASSNTTGSHTHDIRVTDIGNLGAGGTWIAGSEYSGDAQYTSAISDGDHNHSITVNIENVTTGSSGEDGTGKNAPAYVKLAYIMKIS